jgi:hypothetical protein
VTLMAAVAVVSVDRGVSEGPAAAVVTTTG